MRHQFSSLDCSKNCRCDTYLYSEEIGQCISKKYYLVYTLIKRKWGDCEGLTSKYITNDNMLIIYFIYIANLLL